MLLSGVVNTETEKLDGSVCGLFAPGVKKPFSVGVMLMASFKRRCICSCELSLFTPDM